MSINNLDNIYIKNNEISFSKITFPYEEKFYNWILFNSSFWKCLREIDKQDPQYINYINNIYSFPYSYKSNISNLPIPFEYNHQNNFYKNWDVYKEINIDTVRLLSETYDVELYDFWINMIDSFSFINSNIEKMTNPLVDELNSFFDTLSVDSKTDIGLIIKDSLLTGHMSEIILSQIERESFDLSDSNLNINLYKYSYIKSLDVDADVDLSIMDWHMFFGNDFIKDDFINILLSFPRAKHVKCFMFDIPENNSLVNKIDFSDYSVSKSTNISKNYQNVSQSFNIPNGNFNYRDNTIEKNDSNYSALEFITEYYRKKNIDEHEKYINCFALELSTGNVVLFPAENPDVPILNIDKSNFNIFKEDKDNIKIGDFVLLRVGHDPNYIKEISESTLKNQNDLTLEYFNEWKSKFTEYISINGYECLIKQLEGEISIDLNHQTVDRWLAIDTNDIGPGNEKDFLAILKLLDMDYSFEHYIESNKRIRTSRIKAGKSVIKSLKNSITRANLKEKLLLDGSYEFNVDETNNIKLKAFRIVNITEDLFEEYSKLRQLIEINF